MMNSSYSFQLKLLLFLLLITANTTLTISARIPIISGFIPRVKSLGGKVFNSLWENKMGIMEQLSPSQREKDQIEGLNIIKEYLFDFGYLKQKEPYYDNSLDKKTKSAIKTYQKTFNLQDNGFLNIPTLYQISLPRCGVPDINFEYTLSRTNNAPSWPKGNNLLRKDTKLLTYGFAPESNIPLNMIGVFKNALMRWSTATMVLNFAEATSYDVANIKIGFYKSNEGVDDVVVGDSVIILQNSYKSGVIRLNASKYWLLPNENPSWENGDQFDLETVAMHQIGHLLGLDHSFETNSIMYPIFQSKQKKVQISNSDITNMHQLYNNANYGKFGSSSSLLTSLFIGFAFVAMFN